MAEQQVTPHTAGASQPPAQGQHFQVTFTWTGNQDGKNDFYGILPGGGISRLQKNRNSWVDTGVVLPLVNDTIR